MFKKNDYTNSFFSIVEGAVTVEATTSTGAAIAFKLEKGEFFGEIRLDLRPPPHQPLFAPKNVRCW